MIQSLPSPEFKLLEVRVPDAELARLMNIPPGRALSDGAIELIRQARDAFAAVARPWMRFRVVPIQRISENRIILATGDEMTDDKLAKKLRDIAADRVVVVALSVGREVQQKINHLWSEEAGDEAYTLAIFCSSHVEQMLAAVYERLCEYAARHDLAALEPRSPGNDGWDMSHQNLLHRLIRDDPTRAGVLPLTVLDTGSIDPQASQFAIIALTSHLDLAESNPGYRPCSRCSLRDCTYRRR